jgi:hypothetical protein
MNRPHCLLAPVVILCCAMPVWAGGLFSRHPKPKAEERVPQLLVTLKTDQDEHKRSTAAEELRQYDLTAFPNAVNVLIDSLLHDPKPGVRAEVADTLSKIRPVAQQVGLALEGAMAQDTSMRVRLQARYAYLHYYWAGYRTPKKEGAAVAQSDEPPLLAPMPGVAVGSSTPSPRLTPLRSTSAPSQTQGPVVIPASDTPRLKTPPTKIDGPELFPSTTGK